MVRLASNFTKMFSCQSSGCFSIEHFGSDGGVGVDQTRVIGTLNPIFKQKKAAKAFESLPCPATVKVNYLYRKEI